MNTHSMSKIILLWNFNTNSFCIFYYERKQNGYLIKFYEYACRDKRKKNAMKFYAYLNEYGEASKVQCFNFSTHTHTDRETDRHMHTYIYLFTHTHKHTFTFTGENE